MPTFYRFNEVVNKWSERRCFALSNTKHYLGGGPTCCLCLKMGGRIVKVWLPVIVVHVKEAFLRLLGGGGKAR